MRYELELTYVQENGAMFSKKAIVTAIDDMPKAIREQLMVKLDKLIDGLFLTTNNKKEPSESTTSEKGVVYIAGPITGVKDYQTRFSYVQHRLEEKGYIVINPAMLPEGLKHYMAICYAMIDQADIILFLKGWEESEGSCLERAYGIRNKKNLWYEENLW